MCFSSFFDTIETVILNYVQVTLQDGSVKHSVSYLNQNQI